MSLVNIDNLVNHLIDIGALKSQSIINAFKIINRADFVKEDTKDFAYINEALPIGFEQTISQPYTVAFMLELLQPEFHENILEIGFGSGWQTALLAYIVSNPIGETAGVDTIRKSGKVYSFEVIKELCEFGGRNIEKYNFILRSEEQNENLFSFYPDKIKTHGKPFIKNAVVEIFCQNAINGLPEKAKEIGGFDKIISAAAINGDFNQLNIISAIPFEWKKQLKIGGRMVLPINQSIWLFIKKSEENFETFEYPGFIFVPFVE